MFYSGNCEVRYLTEADKPFTIRPLLGLRAIHTDRIWFVSYFVPVDNNAMYFC